MSLRSKFHHPGCVKMVLGWCKENLRRKSGEFRENLCKMVPPEKVNMMMYRLCSVCVKMGLGLFKDNLRIISGEFKENVGRIYAKWPLRRKST